MNGIISSYGQSYLWNVFMAEMNWRVVRDYLQVYGSKYVERKRCHLNCNNNRRRWKYRRRKMKQSEAFWCFATDTSWILLCTHHSNDVNKPAGTSPLSIRIEFFVSPQLFRLSCVNVCVAQHNGHLILVVLGCIP